MGCYACHHIPGYENAKPIGVALNDWGKKAPDRLAFEDIEAFLKDHYHVVDKPGDPNNKETKKALREQQKDGKSLYERFFADALVHGHQSREGFLQQKLLEPRSYDYNRLRAWDDRLRMPQFQFARTRRLKDEGTEEYEFRRQKEEADAREAVMTFILGLVAEPIPAKFVYNPPPDQLAVVKGRAVLDKYNCAGCHQVQPGSYEFKLTPAVNKALSDAYTINAKPGEPKGPYATDYPFHHVAWMGKNPANGTLAAHAVPGQKIEDEDGKALQLFRLSEALRFTNTDGKLVDLRSGSEILLPQPLQAHASPQGGAFANLLVDYLRARFKEDYSGTKASYAVASAPPSLVYEGERAQPGWLFQFLLNPHPIRPMVTQYLRMPRFNMSEDEAKALVNYFAALEKLKNPAIGLTYPYVDIPQREDEFWARQAPAYVERLKKLGLYKQREALLQPVWERLLKDLKDQEADAAAKSKAATAAADAATAAEKKETDPAKKKALEPATKAAQTNAAFWTGEVERLKREVANHSVDAQRKNWEEKDAYRIDAFRLLTNPELCVKCHQVGNFTVGVNQKEQGPSLNLTWERLQPGWLERWISHPNRFLTYSSIMPQNFPANDTGEAFAAYFAGSTLDQTRAARDILMQLPRVAALPASRYLAAPGGGGK
jgi:hypothetical protein